LLQKTAKVRLVERLQRNAGADRQRRVLAWTRAAPVAVGKNPL